ncbi:hypothetical protein [Olleya sp. R77988]|uniref:hypothetical protein n=1 Tax=Olleya sp. R77988 TaxID=3093875 RepID=UPI0037C5D7D9
MKSTTTIICLLLFLGCKNKHTNTDIESATSSNKNYASKTTFYKKPADCDAFFKSINFSNICLENKAKDFNISYTLEKVCQINIKSNQLGINDLKVGYYFENDSAQMEYFNLITEGLKEKNIPGSTYKNINGLGDVAFITSKEKNKEKTLTTIIGNVRVRVFSEYFKSKPHCMYEDDQLIKMAQAIVSKIKNNN